MSSQTLKIHRFTFQENRRGFRSTRSPPAVGLERRASRVCHRCHAAIRISSKIPKSPHVAAGVLGPVSVLSPQGQEQRGAAALGAAAEGRRVCSQVRTAGRPRGNRLLLTALKGRKVCPQWDIIQPTSSSIQNAYSDWALTRKGSKHLVLQGFGHMLLFPYDAIITNEDFNKHGGTSKHNYGKRTAREENKKVGRKSELCL